MQKEIILYPEAFELKQLGFDEVCIYHYKKNDEGEHTSHPTFEMLTPFGKNHNILDSRVSAPTYSQAFRWFRNEHNLDSEVYMNHEYGVKFYSKLILKLEGSVVTHIPGPFEMYKSYEEAELACLRKLIELVKNKES